jgi:hypothetical protein
VAGCPDGEFCCVDDLHHAGACCNTSFPNAILFSIPPGTTATIIGASPSPTTSTSTPNRSSISTQGDLASQSYGGSQGSQTSHATISAATPTTAGSRSKSVDAKSLGIGLGAGLGGFGLIAGLFGLWLWRNKKTRHPNSRLPGVYEDAASYGAARQGYVGAAKPEGAGTNVSVYPQQPGMQQQQVSPPVPQWGRHELEGLPFPRVPAELT